MPVTTGAVGGRTNGGSFSLEAAVARGAPKRNYMLRPANLETGRKRVNPHSVRGRR